MIGKEIVRFHCVYWPAFLLAAGLELPKAIVAHGWLLFEESKMSKSRGNIVRTETILDVLGADALRYFLLREVVFGQDGSFSFDALVQRYNSDLANGLGNLASRTLTMINRYFKGEVPYPSHAASKTPADDCDCGNGAQDDPRIRNAVRSVPVFACARNRVGTGGRGRQIHRRERALGAGRETGRREPGAAGDGALYLGGGVAHCDRAGVSGDARCDGEDLDADGTGRHQETRAEPIWPGDSCRSARSSAMCTRFSRAPTRAQSKGCSRWKISNEVRRWKKRRNRRHRAATLPPAKAQPVAPTAVTSTPAAPAASDGKITIDDFAKIELRVGVVKVAERVPKADKLLRLEIDIGTEVRQVLAGIAEAYAPETLVGRKVVIVANLAPRKLRGLESNGMIVAASLEGGKPVLASFLEDVPVGARLK